jgi:GNAT superfamily N-acetyltransferase
MQIVDLQPSQLALYLVCLKDWDDEWCRDTGPRKQQWYDAFKEKGLRVKLAIDDDGEVAAMIEYLPIEHSRVDGEGLYFIHCIWVHGYMGGLGNRQGRGIGPRLLEVAEEDARARGAKGMVAWGLIRPAWMNAPWFESQGYTRVDEEDVYALVWKPFTEDAVPPKWFKQQKVPRPSPGVVTVTSFVPGWCSSGNLTYELARRAAAELGDRVVFQEHDTSDKAVVREWGISDALFIDGDRIRVGEGLTLEEIRALIRVRLDAL